MGVEPWQDVLEEGGSGVATVHRAVESELGEPDLVDAVLVAKVDSLLDETLQVISVIAVPVNRETSDIASGACVHELLHPVQTLARGVATGHGGADESGLAGVRGDVFFVCLDGVGGVHGGLGRDVGFVEAEDVLATTGKSGLNGRAPSAEHLAAPEHGNVLDTVWDGSVSSHVPVICPGDRVSERLNQ